MQMAAPSSESSADHHYLIKLLLIGDSGVGKSCLLQRFSDDSFTPSSVNTIGIDFKLRTIEIDGKRIKLHLLDTAGQQRFQPITTTYYEGAMGVLLVYDVTDKTSFLNTRKWMDNFHKHTHNDAQLILIGNKADGHDCRRVVPRSRGQALADEYGIKFWETSSKSNVNVEEVFFTISKDILQSVMEKAKGERLLREKALKRPIFSNINESSEGSSGKAQADSSTTTLPKVEQDTNMDSKIILLVDTLRNGSLIEKKDAVTDLSDLSTLHENRVKIVQFGAVTYLVQLMDPSVGMVDEAIVVLANLAKIPEGRNEICVWGGIPVLVDIVELGSEVEKEYAIEALLKLCLHSNRVCNLVIRRKVIPPLLNCTLSGTLRAKQNARALLEYLKIKRFDLNTQVNMKHPARNIHFQHGNRNSNFLWPSPYLLARENRSLYLSIGVPLYNASLCGDWETAKKLIYGNYTIPRTLLCCCITKQYETALHVASGARQVAFVEELLKMMKPKDLTLQDRMGNTAFSLAVAAGTVPIAKMLIEKNSSLLYIPSSANITPLYIAAAFGHHGMAWFIYNQIRDHIRNLEGIFFRCIDTCLFGLALELLRKDSSLAVARNEYNETALHILSRKPSIFVRKNPGTLKGLRKLINSYNRCGDNADSVPNIALQLVTCLWKEILKDQHLDIGETINSPFGLLFEAARMGNHTFLSELIRCYPDLIWEVNNMNQTIFHVAVLHRHASIFNQIHKIGSIKDEIVAYDSDQGDNILHLAARKPSTDRLNTVSGAALQMHQELMWFKEVKSITPSLLREKIGSEGLTPRELFIKEHKDLLKDGEKWMKNTARSCMIVATLITTVVFAAAFSVPGGNNDFGTPIRVNEPLFHVFAISDAMALSSSIISSLMFLYILTSRYAEEDFLDSLPFKLMVGLATLFISMVTMMVAFMAAFFIAYHHHKLRWVPFLSSSFLSVPVTLFVMLQSPLFRDIFGAACSTTPFRSSGSGSKQAGAMIPLAGANLHSPPPAKF